MNKPFSQACENNQAPILAMLREAMAGCQQVLEIGSGTGQHALYFASALSQVNWQTSDLLCNHAGILSWLRDAQLPNALAPLPLDVRDSPWPAGYDGIFTANTLHIMAWDCVEAFFTGVEGALSSGGVLCVYGPFNYRGQFTSDSNARFDCWLKQRDPASGIRDIEAVQELAVAAGLVLSADHAMPANNRLLVWRRR